jgi:hypothetical protein
MDILRTALTLWKLQRSIAPALLLASLTAITSDQAKAQSTEISSFSSPTDESFLPHIPNQTGSESGADLKIGFPRQIESARNNVSPGADRIDRYVILSNSFSFDPDAPNLVTSAHPEEPNRLDPAYLHRASDSPALAKVDTPLCGKSPKTAAVIEQLVAQSATRYGVDLGLAKAIAWTESRFDQRRNSPKGARGPMQLMAETARRFGVTDICDPVANIDGGIRYLRSLIDRFGNPLLAAAAYNAGEGRIYRHHGVPPFAETVRYVAEVVNYQLGLRRGDANSAKRLETVQPDQAPQILRRHSTLGASSAAEFVGGVMQF